MTKSHNKSKQDEIYKLLIFRVTSCCHLLPLVNFNGLKISRKLLSNWVVRIGLALEPLYREMRSKVMQSEALFIEETPLKMQEKQKAKTVYMWVLANNDGYQLYDFKESRCHDNAFQLLKNYSGVVHSDKYGAYEILAQRNKMIWSPCWSHIRRKFKAGFLKVKIRQSLLLDKPWDISADSFHILKIIPSMQVPVWTTIQQKEQSVHLQLGEKIGYLSEVQEEAKQLQCYFL